MISWFRLSNTNTSKQCSCDFRMILLVGSIMIFKSPSGTSLITATVIEANRKFIAIPQSASAKQAAFTEVEITPSSCSKTWRLKFNPALGCNANFTDDSTVSLIIVSVNLLSTPDCPVRGKRFTSISKRSGFSLFRLISIGPNAPVITVVFPWVNCADPSALVEQPSCD